MSQKLYNNLHNDDTEYRVLAACLTREEIYADVRDRLRKEHFVNLDCIKAYEIIKDLEAEGKRPELTEVGMRLMAKGSDMTRFLIEGAAPSYEMTMQMVDLLDELYVRRKTYELCVRGEALANDPTISMDDLDKLTKDLQGVLSGGNEGEVQRYSDVSRELLNDMADRQRNEKETGIMCGLRIFDSHHGFHGGDLVILAGETSQGKTTLATTMARNMAYRGTSVAFYSMEMTAKQLVARIMAGITQVASSQALYERLQTEEYSRYYDKTMQMSGLPIFFDEQGKTTFAGICRSIRRMVAQKGVKVVFIDYLQILANGGRLDSREQIIGDMARDLKRLAVELDICIIPLSQLSRAEKGGGRPSISRLRGSGQIEEAADIVVLIKRDDKGEQATLYIAKGRNIGLDEKKVKFNSRLTYFADYQEGDINKPYEEQDEGLPF